MEGHTRPMVLFPVVVWSLLSPFSSLVCRFCLIIDGRVPVYKGERTQKTIKAVLCSPALFGCRVRVGQSAGTMIAGFRAPKPQSRAEFAPGIRRERRRDVPVPWGFAVSIWISVKGGDFCRVNSPVYNRLKVIQLYHGQSIYGRAWQVQPLNRPHTSWAHRQTPINHTSNFPSHNQIPQLTYLKFIQIHATK